MTVVSRSEFVEIRRRRLAVRHWGAASAPPLFLLHGFADVSASFQFTVEALRREWHVIAPDWRGFGDSQWNDDSYWFPDYLGDLDGLLDHYAPQDAVPLVGHSMGGNLATLYAGVRPGRVSFLISLEGFGLRDMPASEAPGRYRQWLDELRQPSQYRSYANWSALAQRLARDNPRLTPERAEFLARHIGRECRREPGAEGDGGHIMLSFDPHHRRVNPVLYRSEEVKACSREITAPTLLVCGRDSKVLQLAQQNMAEYEARKRCIASLREVVIDDCGHNIHHDQPLKLANLIEDFLP